MKDIAVLYMPVIHRGYLDYLASTSVKRVYVIEASDVPKFEYLTREMRALSAEELAKALLPFGYEVRRFSELRTDDLPGDARIFVPEDDITRSLVFDREVIWGSWFLRWDWSKGTAVGFVQPEADRILRKGDSDYPQASERMTQLLGHARRSSDWWRQVAAMAVCHDGTVVVAYNKHFPHECVPYMDGDPRDSFKPGEFIEISSAMHAEQGVIAEAARRGISTEGAELFVTTFPCNLCAPWIPVAGFRSVYFTGGYSNLNGQRTLRERGVELIYVEM